METAQFIHDGSSIDYTPGGAVTAGAVVVQGEMIGIAKVAIPANALGALAVVGVFDVPKATGASTAITAGANMYWDATNSVATTDDDTGNNKLLGKTVLAATDADATVRIRMNQ